MTDNEDRDRATADAASHAGANGHEAVVSQTPRLVASWLIVGGPLAYGIYQTISKTLPLFGG